MDFKTKICGLRMQLNAQEAAVKMTQQTIETEYKKQAELLTKTEYKPYIDKLVRLTLKDGRFLEGVFACVSAVYWGENWVLHPVLRAVNKKGTPIKRNGHFYDAHLPKTLVKIEDVARLDVIIQY